MLTPQSHTDLIIEMVARCGGDMGTFSRSTLLLMNRDFAISVLGDADCPGAWETIDRLREMVPDREPGDD